MHLTQKAGREFFPCRFFCNTFCLNIKNLDRKVNPAIGTFKNQIAGISANIQEMGRIISKILK